MNPFKRSLSFVAAASAVCGWLVLACTPTPSPVGLIQGGNGGGFVSNGGGSSTNAGGNTDPGRGGAGGGGGGILALPDAAMIREDAVEDVAPATADANCGSVQSKLEKKPADLLLVLDRSSSMTRAMDSANNCAVGDTTCSQRWATITSSLGEVLASSSNDLNWGLKFFSSPTTGTGGSGGTGTSSSCYVAVGVEVPVGPGNANAIQTRISAVGTATSTPTRAAVDAAVVYLKTVNDGNNKFILLATDGEPNCASGSSGTGTADLPATVTAVENAVAAGYKVFVIGVGPEATNLTSLAQAGGTEKFYSALTPDALLDALASIVTTVAAGCTYELPSVPTAPDAVGVFVDKSLIPQDDSEGWSYESGSSTTITIHGSYCDDLTSGKKTQVEIFLPCKTSDPIPTVIP
jgi:hypothetical protein